jgi:inhibitor of cysteine peptidase
MKRIIIIYWLIPWLLFGCAPYAKIIDSTDISQVKPGENFLIVLESNPTTGYSWELSQPLNKNYIKLINAKYVSAESRLSGAAGKEVWTFKALKPGETLISFSYLRSWEKDGQPADKKEFRLIIRQ